MWLVSRLRPLFGSTAATISSVHPLVYLVVYFLLVPVFAIVYCQLSHGFHAPYAYLEDSGWSDNFQMRNKIQSAFSRKIKNNGDHSTVGEWRILPELIFVSGFQATSSGELTFDVSVLTENQTSGKLLRVRVKAILLLGTTHVEGPEGEFKIYRSFEIQRPDRGSDLAKLNEQLFDQLVKDFRSVEFLPEEHRALSRFLAGVTGDALSVSNSFVRMLYFSAIVITTVGFGDIVPMTGAARSLVAIEALLGVILAGLFLNAIAYRAARRGGGSA